MSELTGPHTRTNPKLFSEFDSIQALREAGQPYEGLELVIDNPDVEGNGEICLRGRNVFMGYFKNEAQTIATIDKRGFVHSGDVGVVNPKGVLIITGRIKELIITAGGENIAPVLIENEINTFLPIFSNAVVVGDKRKFLAVLLCLKLKNPTTLNDEVIEYIKQRGSPVKTLEGALKCRRVQQIIKEGLEKVNEKAISNAHKVQRFAILPLQFTIDSGLLTPTMKLKRKIINQRFQKEIEALYLDAKL